MFDNRNQAYGAYLIRRAYSQRLLLSFGVSVAMAALVLLLPTLLREEVKLPVLPKDLIGDVILTERPIVIPRPQPPAARPPVRRQTVTSTAIQVVPDDVQTAPASDVQASVVSSDEGVEGSTGFDDVQITGTSIPVEAPVVSSEPPTRIEIMPEYVGGIAELMKFVKRNLRYSAKARRLGIDGTVFVSFVVNGDGSVSNVTVLRGIDRDCDEEAARVIAMLPGWKGGKQGGYPAAVRMVLPIKFALQ